MYSIIKNIKIDKISLGVFHGDVGGKFYSKGEKRKRLLREGN